MVEAEVLTPVKTMRTTTNVRRSFLVSRGTRADSENEDLNEVMEEAERPTELSGTLYPFF